MYKRKFLNILNILLVLALVASSSIWAAFPATAQSPNGNGNGNGKGLNLHGAVTPAERQAAAKNAASKGLVLGTAAVTGAAAAAAPGPGGTPDYFGSSPNFANSPLPTGSISSTITVNSGGTGYTTPTVTISDVYGTGTGATATATVVGGAITGITLNTAGSGYTDPVVTIKDPSTTAAGASATAILDLATITGGIRKFMDPLPALPIAVADTTSYPAVGTTPAADYYEIALVEYTQKMSTDLPPTTLRGYVQISKTATSFPLKHLDNTPILINSAQAYGVTAPTYLGPVIVATKDKPVRIKFYNLLPTGAAGNLFIPVDTTYMGAGAGPSGSNYTENRATLHLHGGVTPWISDGTPHQWTTPAGETTAYPEGVSVYNVPDMDGGKEPVGTLTFYYSNQQSARLMFYHDHSYGITRLNVYAGEAAGYLVTDSAEQSMIAAGTLPDIGTPLVIQDKTFVDSTTIAAQDPTWNESRVTGSLWFPHVYMPNQNPYDITGANAMGRWDYGPWFWPPYTGLQIGPQANPYYDPVNAPWEPPVIPGTPNVSGVPEGFMDTPIVNGVAYPTTTVPAGLVRWRILNAANDRFLNLSLWVADSTTVYPATYTGPKNTEVKMVPFNSSQNAITPFPLSWYTQGLPKALDDRAGGVPDPTTRGPAMVQIGTEGGFLPAPAVINNQPVNYDYNLRSITVLNVLQHALFLGPAERADVVVDFSQFAGKTLILYNDSPAPVPAGDPRNDYYTGDPDQTATGGAPSTLPGYGPNTRTIMQIKVAGTDSGTPGPVDYVNQANLTALQAALSAAFKTTEDTIIVPQAPYNSVYGTNVAANDLSQFVQIQANSTTLTPIGASVVGSINVTNGGSGYTTPPAVSITAPTGANPVQATATSTLGTVGLVKSVTVSNGGSGYKTAPTVLFSAPATVGGVTATGTAVIVSGKVTGVTVTNPGSGYTAPPVIAFSGGGGKSAAATAVLGFPVAAITVTNGGSGYTALPTVTVAPPGGSFTTATATASFALTMALQPKAIQELFTVDYGRMNATLGVELPNSNATTQTTIPYGYIDPPTEIIKITDPSVTAIGALNDGTQLWKITHNGVDTHAMHVHMFNMQLVNRVGWDGAIKPPDVNELGWKDTIRMNPLEDIIVALRPIVITNLPWDLPNSVRPLDVTAPLGSTMGFFNVDTNGNPVTVTNQMVNYGWEYVWHCHLLGHEENDMMRPMIIAIAPKAPTAPTVLNGSKGVTLTWKDQSMNETAFIVQRAPVVNGVTGNWTSLALTAKAAAGSGSTVTYLDATVTKGTWAYRVIASNVVGSQIAGYPTNTANSAPSAPSANVTH